MSEEEISFQDLYHEGGMEEGRLLYLQYIEPLILLARKNVERSLRKEMKDE